MVSTRISRLFQIFMSKWVKARKQLILSQWDAVGYLAISFLQNCCFHPQMRWQTKKGTLWFFFLVYGSSNAYAQSPIGPSDVCFACSLIKVSTAFLRTSKALVRLRLCAGLPEPFLVAYSHVLTQIRKDIMACKIQYILKRPTPMHM